MAEKDRPCAGVGASVASLPGSSLDEAIERLADLEFAGIEILAFAGARHSQGDLPGIWLDAASAQRSGALRERLTPFPCISTHAPFIDVRLSTHNPGIRRESLRQIRETIAGTARIGGTLTTVHANARAFFSLEETWQDLVEVLCELADTGERHGVRVALETMYPPTVESFVALVRDCDHPFLGACVDVGHVAWTVPNDLRGTEAGVRLYNDNLEALIRSLGDRLFSLHVHDVRRADWRDHRCPGRGCVDYPRLVDALGGLAPEVCLLLELEEPDVEAALLEGRAFLRRCAARRDDT